MRAITARAFVALVIAQMACSGGSSEDAAGSAESAIEHGDVVSGDSPTVALVRAGVVYCSGTLVAPKLVATAAHCLEHPPTEVSIGSSAARILVARTHAHSSFDARTLANDIGVIELAAPAPVRPAEPSRAGALSVGTSVRVSGFGATRSPWAAPAKREGTSRVDAVETGFYVIRPDPAQPCGGDSGGSAFVDEADGPKLVGVISAGDLMCGQYGKLTRIDRQLEFLELYLRPPAPPVGGCAAR